MEMEKAKKIYIVDDEKGVLSSLNRLLRKEGYTIETFESGEDAIARIELQPPDLVISDYKMPGMDGLALLNRIEGTYPSIVKIMMSGFADVNEVLAASDINIFKFITKPWDDTQFKKIIADALLAGNTSAQTEEEADLPLTETADLSSFDSFWSDEDRTLLPVDILNALPVALIGVNMEGGVEFVNKRWEEVFKVSLDLDASSSADSLPLPVRAGFRQAVDANTAIEVKRFVHEGSSFEGEWIPVPGKGAVLFVINVSKG